MPSKGTRRNDYSPTRLTRPHRGGAGRVKACEGETRRRRVLGGFGRVGEKGKRTQAHARPAISAEDRNGSLLASRLTRRATRGRRLLYRIR